MRVGRRQAVAMVAALGTALLAVTGPVAARGPGVSLAAEVPETGAFLFQGPKVKGLVALTQSGTTATLRFHIFGLKPERQYRLVGRSKGCASTNGTLFRRTFQTTAAGFTWDPVTYQIDARKVVSVRIVNAATGATVACVGSAEIPFTAAATAAKLRAGRIRGLAVETEPAVGSWTVAATFTGLIPNGDYWMFGRTGTCAVPVAGVWSRSVDANGSGKALELYYPSPQAHTATIIELKPADASDEDDPALICRQIR